MIKTSRQISVYNSYHFLVKARVAAGLRSRRRRRGASSGGCRGPRAPWPAGPRPRAPPRARAPAAGWPPRSPDTKHRYSVFSFVCGIDFIVFSCCVWRKMMWIASCFDRLSDQQPTWALKWIKTVRRPSNEKKLKEKLLPLSVLVLNGRVGLDTKWLRCPLAQMAQHCDEDQDVTLDTPSLEWRRRWQLSSNWDSALGPHQYQTPRKWALYGDCILYRWIRYVIIHGVWCKSVYSTPDLIWDNPFPLP